MFEWAPLQGRNQLILEEDAGHVHPFAYHQGKISPYQPFTFWAHQSKVGIFHFYLTQQLVAHHPTVTIKHIVI